MDDLIFTEEVAELLGTSVGGVRQAQRRARSARRAYAVAIANGISETEAAEACGIGPHLLPEPVDRVTRSRPAKGHPRKVIDSPRWSRAEIETYKTHRRGPGGRERAEVAS